MNNLNRSEASVPATPKGTHVSKACANCQQRKAKCDSNRPCRSCTGASLECRESEKPDGRNKRKGAIDHDVEGSIVQALESRIGKLESTVAVQSMQIASLAAMMENRLPHDHSLLMVDAASNQFPRSSGAIFGTSTRAPFTTPSFGGLGGPEASRFLGVTEGCGTNPYSPTTHLLPSIHIPSSSPGSTEYSSLQNDLTPSDSPIDHRPDPTFLNRPVAHPIVQSPFMSTAPWTSHTGSTAFATAATSTTTTASTPFASPVYPLPHRGNTAGQPSAPPVFTLTSNALSREQRTEKSHDSPLFWEPKPPN